MGFPSPHDMYGTLTYRDATYNLANRVFDKALADKLTAHIKKEQINYLPIYPHIPKNPLTAYEIIDERLYITGISFNGKPYSLKAIFGEEKVACRCDATLEVVAKITDFIVEKSRVSRREIKKFTFQNGLLKEIEEEVHFWERKIVSLELLLEGTEGVDGIFWIADDRIYSAKQPAIKSDSRWLGWLSHCEIWDYFAKRYDVLRGFECEALRHGRVVFDAKHGEFIVYVDSQADVDLVVNAFDLQEKTIKVVIDKREEKSCKRY